MASTAPKLPNIAGYIMAVQRVEELLRKVTKALEAAGVPYAVVGGHAVAAWVASVDEAAVRATKDVDILLRREDLGRAAEALRPVGLIPAEVMGVHMFVDKEHPSPRTGVHVIVAREPITWRDQHPAPDPQSAVPAASGFAVLGLLELLVMKLQAFRPIDRAHVEDLISLGLISDQIVERVPADLAPRLGAIREEMNARRPPP